MVDDIAEVLFGKNEVLDHFSKMWQMLLQCDNGITWFLFLNHTILSFQNTPYTP